MAEIPLDHDTIKIESRLENAGLRIGLDEAEGGMAPKAEPESRSPAEMSLYVQAVNLALETVLASHESSYLLTDTERNALHAFIALNAEAKFLFIRLLLRKPGKVHRLRDLKYTQELGTHIPACIEYLSQCCPAEQEEPVNQIPGTVKSEPIDVDNPETIDLTLDSDDEDSKDAYNNVKVEENATAGSSRLMQEAPDYSVFCFNKDAMSLEDILHALHLEDLKALAKALKLVKPPTKREALVSALLATSATQSTISSHFSLAVKSSSNGLKQVKLTSLFNKNTKQISSSESQLTRLKHMALEKLDAVWVNPDYYTLLRRVISVIYLRCTKLTDDLGLTPSILALFNKRNYVETTTRRTDGVLWKTRDELLAYEAALQIELEVDNINQDGLPNDNVASRASRTPARTGLKKEDISEEPNDNIEQARARAIIKLAEPVHAVWRQQCAAADTAIKTEAQSKSSIGILKRFTPGHINTRIMCKLYEAYHKVKEYEAELKLLNELLAQTIWRRSRRGKWYIQRALVQGPKYCREEAEIIITGVEQGLDDPDTTSVDRPTLQKKFTSLQRKLVSEEEQRRFPEQRMAVEIVVVAERIPRDESADFDQQGQPKSNKGKGKIARIVSTPVAHRDLALYFTPDSTRGASVLSTLDGQTLAPDQIAQLTSFGRTIWRGADGDEINVEARALEYYASLGFRGFHSESRILTTVFGILFWDILFADIPGAFETKFQAGPLDLYESDSFYDARADHIKARLAEIKAGGALRLVTDRAAEREKQAWCIGVSWDLCTHEELLEILECVGPESLALICRLFCYDYGIYSSGGPDLIIWNHEKRIVKFVEVKSKKDRLQKNQNNWIDALLRSDVAVEVCSVLTEAELESRGTKRERGAAKGKTKREPESKKRKVEAQSESDSDTIPGIDEDDAQVNQLEGDDDDYTPQVKSASRKQMGGPATRSTCKSERKSYDAEDLEESVLPDYSRPALFAANTVKRRRRAVASSP